MIKSRIAVVLTAAALIVGGAGHFSPASADVFLPTTTTLTAYKTVGVYGDFNGFTGSVTESGGSVPVGTANLERLTPGSSTWVTVATDTSPGYLYFPDINFSGNARYRVSYAGAIDGGNTYTESTSNEISVSTYRALNDRGIKRHKKLILAAQVVPNWNGRPVVVETLKCAKKKKHKPRTCTWRTYKRVTTSSTGTMQVTVKAARGGKQYRIVVPGDADFLTSVSSVWKAVRY